MKKKIVIIIILILCIIAVAMYFMIKIDSQSIKAVILKVNKEKLAVMDIKDEVLYYISIPQNNKIQFAKNQEVKVSYDYNTIIEQTIPASIKDVKDIKIIKETSNIEVPKKHLERLYNSSDNIYISVDKVSQTGITITIKDMNEYKRDYKYSSDYEIIDKDIHKTLTNKTKNKKVGYCKIIDNNTVTNTYNWENIYGTLESGRYQFKAQTQDHYINIFIDFSINTNGEITCEQTKCALIF